MTKKCINCLSEITTWHHWEKYQNNKKVLEIDICPDCFVDQCVYNTLKLFVQAPLKYILMTKEIYPYLLKDKDLTEDQKKRLKNFFKNQIHN